MQAGVDPSVLISVLNWNAAENTILSVHSALQSTYQKYTIVILDNHSTDGSVKTLHEAFPHIELIRLESNVGYAAAHKLAAEKAIRERFELLWILNNDVVVAKDALQKMIAFYRKIPNGVYGGVCVESHTSKVLFAGGMELNEHGQFDLRQPYNKFRGQYISSFKEGELTRQVGNVEGSNFLIPVQVIKKHGFICTNFFLYGEETDYSIRLWLKHKVGSFLVGEAIVEHKESSSFEIKKELELVKLYYLTRNTEYVFRKYFRQPTKDKAASLFHLFKFFIKHSVRKAGKTDLEYRRQYFKRLAYLHAVLGIRGKRVAPEKFGKE